MIWSVLYSVALICVECSSEVWIPSAPPVLPLRQLVAPKVGSRVLPSVAAISVGGLCCAAVISAGGLCCAAVISAGGLCCAATISVGGLCCAAAISVGGLCCAAAISVGGLCCAAAISVGGLCFVHPLSPGVGCVVQPRSPWVGWIVQPCTRAPVMANYFGQVGEFDPAKEDWTHYAERVEHFFRSEWRYE